MLVFGSAAPRLSNSVKSTGLRYGANVPFRYISLTARAHVGVLTSIEFTPRARVDLSPIVTYSPAGAGISWNRANSSATRWGVRFTYR